ncbi:hypothetical protein M2101_001441 [Parabacteroides sp. PM5-20]|nr:hypothetical protein [Parabacteroides sp. PM5-20]
MKKRQFWYILTVLFFLSFHSYATDNLRLPDIRSMGTGGNGVTQTSFFNPALVTLADKKTLQIHYFNRYHLKELGTVTGSFLYPNPILSAAIHLSSFGYDDYRESLLRFSLGKQLNERWALGIGIHYSLLQTALFDERPSRLSTDIGATFSPFDNLLIGMLIMNAPSVSIGDKRADNNNFSGYNIQMGIQWEVINSLLIMGSMGTEKEQVLTGSIGMEYRAFNSFYLRAGIQSTPLLPSLGIGYDLSLFSIDVATVYHPVLGMSTGLGLSFTF